MPEYVRPPAEHPNPDRVVAVGTALFLLGFVVLLPCYGWLGDHGHRDWLWTCLAGTLLGIAGYALMRRHRRLGRV